MTSLLAFSVVVFMVAFAGSRFKPGPWHAALKKPSWNPPNWVFAPVWTVLYICMAVAGSLTWRAVGQGWSTPLAFWMLQLVANGLWTWIFFGRHRIDLALADIGATWIFIVGFIVTAWAREPIAAMLFLPYAAWVTFAAALNASIWAMNRSSPARAIPAARARPRRFAPPPI